MPVPGMLVCVVDDDLSVRRGLRRLLAVAGYDVEVFGSAGALLADDAMIRAQCVVADVVMPGIDGFDLWAELQRTRPGVPIVFVTAHDSEAVRDRARTCGATAYFRKPVDGDELLDAIEKAISGVRPAVAGAPPRPEPISGAATLLVVEDQEALRGVIANTLKEAGYQVIEASNGEEALRAVRHHDGPLHLLLSDVVMPRITGRELAARVRGTRPGVRVLYVSGYTTGDIVQKRVLEPGEAFLQRPFRRKALLQKVRELLGETGRPEGR